VAVSVVGVFVPEKSVAGAPVVGVPLVGVPVEREKIKGEPVAGEPVTVGSPVDRLVVLGLSRGGVGVSVFVRGSCSSLSEDSKEKKVEVCALGLVVLSGVLGEIVESVLVIVGCADCRGEGAGSEVEVGCFREDRAEGIMGLLMIGVGLGEEEA
jgi:hypothetical protein